MLTRDEVMKSVIYDLEEKILNLSERMKVLEDKEETVRSNTVKK